MSEEARVHVRTLGNGLKVYKVLLKDGPHDGCHSYASGDVVWQGGEKYLRGSDDLYYHEPKAGGKN